MKPLDQNRSIDAHKLNHTAKVLNKFVPHGSILERLRATASKSESESTDTAAFVPVIT